MHKELPANTLEEMKYIDIAKEQLIGILRDTEGMFQMACGTRYRPAVGSEKANCLMFVPRETLKLDAERRVSSSRYKPKRNIVQ